MSEIMVEGKAYEFYKRDPPVTLYRRIEDDALGWFLNYTFIRIDEERSGIHRKSEVKE